MQVQDIFLKCRTFPRNLNSKSIDLRSATKNRNATWPEQEPCYPEQCPDRDIQWAQVGDFGYKNILASVVFGTDKYAIWRAPLEQTDPILVLIDSNISRIIEEEELSNVRIDTDLFSQL